MWGTLGTSVRHTAFSQSARRPRAALRSQMSITSLAGHAARMAGGKGQLNASNHHWIVPTRPPSCRCFDRVPLVAPLSLHCNLSTEAPTCSENCSAALRNVRTGLGCCFNTLFNVSDGWERYPFSHTELWERCEQASPSGKCAGCSHAQSLGATGAGVAAILTTGLWLTL